MRRRLAPPSLEEARGWVGDAGRRSRAGRRRPRSTASSSTPTAAPPTWLIVKQGRVGGDRSSRSRCATAPPPPGRVWVAHERETIRSAPVVDPTRPLLREHELTICAHYGVGEGVGRAAEVAGRAEGAVTSQPAA